MNEPTLPSIFVAFFAGLLSFLSPCVLPLIPMYLSFISGESITDIMNEKAVRTRLFFKSLSFVLGFTVVFVLLAFLFGTGVHFIGSSIPGLITKISGMLIIILGLNILFDFIPFLRTELRATKAINGASFSKAFLFGMLFAAGWSPCIGPILSSILIFAAGSGNPIYAVILLIAYSFGLGLPFLIVGFFFDKADGLLNWLKRHSKGIRIISGVLIVIFGLLMLTEGLDSITRIFLSMSYSLQSVAEKDIPIISVIASKLAAWLQFQGI